MKIYYILFLSIVLILSLVAGCSIKTTMGPPSTVSTMQMTVPRGKITLSLNLTIPETNARWIVNIQPWVEKIEQRTNGEVTIVPYFSDTLSSLSQNYDSVVSGVADMGSSGLQPGEFPLTEQIAGFYSASTYPSNPSVILWNLYKDFPQIQNEFKETHLLFLESSLPSRIGSTKPINTLQGLKGLKIGMQGLSLSANKLTSLGTNPVYIDSSEAYMSLQTGVVNGFMADCNLMVSSRYGNVLHYLNNVNVACSSFYMTMNIKTWNNLPANIKQVFNELSGDYAVKTFDNGWKQIENHNEIIYKQQMGGKILQFSQNNMEIINSKFQACINNEISDLESKGLPAKQVYQEFQQLEAQNSTSWP